MEHSCPLFEEAILHNIGETGNGPEVPNILNGTYTPLPGTSKPVCTFLHYMCRSSKTLTLQISDCFMSLEEFVHSWKGVRTSTSSIGPHIGHYKAATQNLQLTKIFHMKLEIPFLGVFAPDRYPKWLDVMIMKKAESNSIGDLRTVVLFDSEANHGNKWIGKFTMNKAVQQGDIATEQYSQTGHSAEDHALKQKLTFNHHKFKCSPLALVCSGLKSCYNRVVHAAVSLALQRIGLPIEFILGMFGLIQQMIHHIYTGFDESALSYGGEHIPSSYCHYLQGLNQGNGAGPTLWSAFSLVNFEILREKCFGTKFCCPITKATLYLVRISYMDDCDLANLMSLFSHFSCYFYYYK